jgi:hypothetical protein
MHSRLYIGAGLRAGTANIVKREKIKKEKKKKRDGSKNRK